MLKSEFLYYIFPAQLTPFKHLPDSKAKLEPHLERPNELDKAALKSVDETSSVGMLKPMDCEELAGEELSSCDSSGSDYQSDDDDSESEDEYFDLTFR